VPTLEVPQKPTEPTKPAVKYGRGRPYKNFVMENYLTSTGTSVKQSPPTDISVLIQEAPFTDSRRKEINGLLKKDVFAVVMEKDIPQGVCIFNLRFINKIKHPSTNKAFKKSRLVIQAYND
jgi:hypothetical protein